MASTVMMHSTSAMMMMATGVGGGAKRGSVVKGCTVAKRFGRSARIGGISAVSLVRRRSETIVAMAAADEKEQGAGAGAVDAKDEVEEQQLAFEPKSKSKKKKRKRRTGENTRRASIQVEGLAIDAAKGQATPTIESASEEAFVLFLFGYIVVIFLLGLLLAASAFSILPDKAETWVTGTLYPAYSPIVIGFLVFSSIYGVIKTRNDPDSSVGR